MVIIEFLTVCVALFIVVRAVRNTFNSQVVVQGHPFFGVVLGVWAILLWPVTLWLIDIRAVWFFALLMVSSVGHLCVTVDVYRGTRTLRP
tara:strand:- start:5144 stop:5413 length:270 start_codon:yes stop_codon:yes gene_type:complete